MTEPKAYSVIAFAETIAGIFLCCGKEAPRGIQLYFAMLFVIWAQLDFQRAGNLYAAWFG